MDRKKRAIQRIEAAAEAEIEAAGLVKNPLVANAMRAGAAARALAEIAVVAATPDGNGAKHGSK